MKNIINSDKLIYVFSILILFVFGLAIPKISQLTVYILITIVFFRRRFDFINESFLLLLLFCVTYYLISYSYGYINMYLAIHRSLLFLGFYAFGYSISRRNTPKWPYGIIILLLSFISGAVIYTFLSTFFTGGSQTMTLIAQGERADNVEDFWNSGEESLATSFGMFGSLGINLLPMLLFRKDRSLSFSEYLPLQLVITVVGIAALSTNILLQNRASVIALALSLLAPFTIFIFKKDKPLIAKGRVIIILGVIIMGAFGYFSILSDTILIRFQERGLESLRYVAWSNFIQKAPDHLWGGKAFDIGIGYVHNLYGDVFYDAGVIPALALALFHLSILMSCIKVIRARLPFLVTIFLTCVGISYAIGFAIEPALQSSALYFASSCFFLGTIQGMARDVKYLESSSVKRSHYETLLSPSVQ